MNDDRFKRCVEKKQNGTTMEYKPPFPDLAKLERSLLQVEEACTKTDDVGIHSIAEYVRDFVGLVRDFDLNPEALELAVQEFGFPKR